LDEERVALVNNNENASGPPSEKQGVSPSTKMPGAVLRPGTNHQFQFQEFTDL
jgi:hypothetical protein